MVVVFLLLGGQETALPLVTLVIIAFTHIQMTLSRHQK